MHSSHPCQITKRSLDSFWMSLALKLETTLLPSKSGLYKTITWYNSRSLQEIQCPDACVYEVTIKPYCHLLKLCFFKKEKKISLIPVFALSLTLSLVFLCCGPEKSIIYTDLISSNSFPSTSQPGD